MNWMLDPKRLERVKREQELEDKKQMAFVILFEIAVALCVAAVLFLVLIFI